MQVIEKHIQQIQEEADAAAQAPQVAFDDAQELILLCDGFWIATKEFLATFPFNDREGKRAVARWLRCAERAMSAVLALTGRFEEALEGFRGIGRLRDAVREVRGMILMPTARQMADRDELHRTPYELRDALLQRVTFADGFPVITSEIASDFPSPLDPEPA